MLDDGYWKEVHRWVWKSGDEWGWQKLLGALNVWYSCIKKALIGWLFFQLRKQTSESKTSGLFESLTKIHMGGNSGVWNQDRRVFKDLRKCFNETYFCSEDNFCWNQRLISVQDSRLMIDAGVSNVKPVFIWYKTKPLSSKSNLDHQQAGTNKDRVLQQTWSYWIFSVLYPSLMLREKKLSFQTVISAF